MSNRLWRTLAVMAMKSLSHEPQSLSMASLVRKLVVRGPGVSKTASRCVVMGTSSKKVAHCS